MLNLGLHGYLQLDPIIALMQSVYNGVGILVSFMVHTMPSLYCNPINLVYMKWNSIYFPQFDGIIFSFKNSLRIVHLISSSL